MLLEMNNNLFETTAKTWFGDLGDFVSFRCIIHDLRNNIPISPSRVSEFNDKNIGNLILKVAPIIKPLDQVLCEKIDYNEKARMLETADYNTLFDYYKGYGFSDEDIASIIIILEIRGIINGWGRKDISMLATKMKPEAFRYVAMLDSY